MLSIAIFAIVVAAILLLIMGIRARAASAQEHLPRFTREDMPREERIAAFVDAFIDRDPQARELLNPSNRTMFAEGYRPTWGMPYNPEASGERFTDIRRYFIRKLYLDLNAIKPLNQGLFESFVDQIGNDSDKTLICKGEIAMRHNLNVKGNFNFQRELAKIPQGQEREEFKRCWLNDSILGTEGRMLGWMFRQLFGVPYHPKH